VAVAVPVAVAVGPEVPVDRGSAGAYDALISAMVALSAISSNSWRTHQYKSVRTVGKCTPTHSNTHKHTDLHTHKHTQHLNNNNNHKTSA
jgi:hypothetical protein